MLLFDKHSIQWICARVNIYISTEYECFTKRKMSCQSTTENKLNLNCKCEHYRRVIFKIFNAIMTGPKGEKIKSDT